MRSVYLSSKQYLLLEEFYNGRIARVVEAKKIYEKDRWAFVELLGNNVEFIDGKSIIKLINEGYVEIFADDGFTKMKITGKGKSLIYNNSGI